MSAAPSVGPWATEGTKHSVSSLSCSFTVGGPLGTGTHRPQIEARKVLGQPDGTSRYVYHRHPSHDLGHFQYHPPPLPSAPSPLPQHHPLPPPSTRPPALSALSSPPPPPLTSFAHYGHPHPALSQWPPPTSCAPSTSGHGTAWPRPLPAPVQEGFRTWAVAFGDGSGGRGRRPLCRCHPGPGLTSSSTWWTAQSCAQGPEEALAS